MNGTGRPVWRSAAKYVSAVQLLLYGHVWHALAHRGSQARKHGIRREQRLDGFALVVSHQRRIEALKGDVVLLGKGP
jgi:hypothetical protein